MNVVARAPVAPAVPAGLFVLPEPLRTRLRAEARAAFPRECCGLIEGVRDARRIVACALHPARNLADAPDRFVIDPAEHFRLLRALRGTERAIIGCYHSHPGGMPVPSEHDCAMAIDDGFVWLIAASTAAGHVTLAAHLFADGAFRALELGL
jgi:proteasome lid subunit RPN8/RPN11